MASKESKKKGKEKPKEFGTDLEVYGLAIGVLEEGDIPIREEDVEEATKAVLEAIGNAEEGDERVTKEMADWFNKEGEKRGLFDDIDKKEELEEKVIKKYELTDLELYAVTMGIIEEEDVPISGEDREVVIEALLKAVDEIDENDERVTKEMLEWFNVEGEKRGLFVKNNKQVEEDIEENAVVEKAVQKESIPSIILIERILIGNRYRKDLGDIEGLAKSIAEKNLFHPIVIDSQMNLIAGLRRIIAAKFLGWSEIPCRVIDLDNIIEGEYAENVNRKDFSPSEAVAIAEALKPKIREQAKKRQKAGKVKMDKETGSYVNLTELKKSDLDRGKTTRGILGDFVSISGSSLEKAKRVVEKSRMEPELYGDLVEKMDATGKVDPAYQEMKKREKKGEKKGDKGEEKENIFSYRKKGKYLLIIKFNKGVEITRELLVEVVSEFTEEIGKIE